MSSKDVFECMNNFTGIATVITLIINTAALLLVIYQAHLSKQALSATRKSIDDAKTERQLDVLPKINWIITVQVCLKNWEQSLQEKQVKLLRALNEKDDNILTALANTHIKSPKDLALDRFLYDNMPTWLREIWMSGAQYYYDAMAPMQCLWKESVGAQYPIADSLNERCAESEKAISVLLEYIKDMVPQVILNTPASLSNETFFNQ